eukprot:UN00438
MCKLRVITWTKPYNIYSGVDAAGSVLFYEPINPYYLIIRAIFVVYSTAVITWSMADLAEQNISYSLWFAFRINWITLLIWIYFIISLFISIFVNYYKRTNESLTIPSFTEWDPDGNGSESDDNEINYNRLKTYKYKLYRLHQFSRICLQISISGIIFMSILYYIDYKHIFKQNAIPQFVLNIQTHGILAIGLCLDYFTSCTQIRYIFGSFLVLLFNVISLVWTYIFYQADFYNPLTQSNILYPIANWTSGSAQFFTTFQIFIGGTVAHWFIHIVLVYLKFVVICNWIDRRRFTMDIIDQKATNLNVS